MEDEPNEETIAAIEEARHRQTYDADSLFADVDKLMEALNAE